MKDFQYVLFDLDGTLIDSGLGVTNAVMYALRKFDIVEEDRARLYRFIGPPIWDTFQHFYGFPEEKATLAVAHYRDYYREKGVFENELYDGVEEMVKELSRAGKTLLIATSKPEVFAKKILEYFGLAGYFSHIVGATLDGKLVKKEDIIGLALEKSGVKEKERAIMVGDREYDITGAKKNEISSIGVLFGFGSREEIHNSGADYFAESPQKIQEILLSPDKPPEKGKG